MPQQIYAFRACRCFRKDSRRVISALAARTASALVGFCFGSGVLFTPTVGSVGRTWVGNIEGRSIGCVIIGPAAGLFLGILENAFQLCETFSALKITCVSVILWIWACGDLKPGQKPCHNSPNTERSRDYLVLKGARAQSIHCRLTDDAHVGNFSGARLAQLAPFIRSCFIGRISYLAPTSSRIIGSAAVRRSTSVWSFAEKIDSPHPPSGSSTGP